MPRSSTNFGATSLNFHDVRGNLGASGSYPLGGFQWQVSKWLVEAGRSRFDAEIQDGGRTYIYRLVDVPTTPVEWSLIMGDAVHNLRSALDLLAWQAVIAGVGTPSRSTCSPIYKKQEDRKFSLALKGAPSHFIDAVRQMQPYIDAPMAEAWRGGRLWLLYRLDIEDKHHLLVTCPGVVNEMSSNRPPEVDGCEFIGTWQPAAEGVEVMRFSGRNQGRPHRHTLDATNHSLINLRLPVTGYRRPAATNRRSSTPRRSGQRSRN